MCCRYLFCILCITYVAASFESWTDVLADIVLKEFRKSHILILSDAAKNQRNFSRKLLEENSGDPVQDIILTLSKSWTLCFFDYSHQHPLSDVTHFKTWKAQQVVVILREKLIASPLLLTSEIKRWKANPCWSGRAAILVVMLGGGSAEAHDVFSELWRQTKAANVVIMAVQGGVVQLFGSEPYSPQCTVSVFRIGVWGSKAPHNHTIFPARNFGNLNQCKIIAASVAVAPYVYSSNGSTQFTEGVEIRIFRTLAEMMNFSYEYIASPVGESPWMLFQDGKPAGLIGRLHRLEADVAFFGIRLTWQRYQLVDIIDSYYGDSFVWVSTLPERIPSWHSFFTVFDLYLWLWALLVLLLFAAVFSALTRITLVAALAIALGFSFNVCQPCTTQRLLLRFLLTCYLTYVLNITAAYQSGLFSEMTTASFAPPVDSAMEAAHEGFIFDVYPSAILEMKASHPELYAYIISNKLANWNEDHVSSLKRIAQQKREILLLSSMVVRYEKKRSFKTPDGKSLLRTLKVPYGSYEPVFHMSRDHPLQPAMQSAMRRLIECGWVEIYIDTLLDRDDASGLAENDTDRTLSMSNLFGAFVMLVGLLFVATTTLVGELAYVWLKARIQKVSR